MTQEQKGLEPGKDYTFSSEGTVKFVGKDAFGMDKFIPVKGKFSGEAITLTEHQVQLLISPTATSTSKPEGHLLRIP